LVEDYLRTYEGWIKGILLNGIESVICSKGELLGVKNGVSLGKNKVGMN